MRIAILLSLVLCVAVSGCASKKSCCALKASSEKASQEIIVQKPYDYVYLGILDVTNDMDSWVPNKTLKSDGLIRIRNTDYTKFDDSDRRTIDIYVRRDGQATTGIYIHPNSQSVIGVSDVLDAIREKFDVA